MLNNQIDRIKMNKKNITDTRNFQKTKMQKEIITQKLKEKGCRITKQRLLILDIILEDECDSCKEIYYKASFIDHSIGIATIYRFVNTLEEIGAISRKNMYKVAYSENCKMENACIITLDDNTTYRLSAKKWNDIIKIGLHAFGYVKNQKITSVVIKECESECDRC